jgi:hypothetical protein
MLLILEIAAGVALGLWVFETLKRAPTLPAETTAGDLFSSVIRYFLPVLLVGAVVAIIWLPFWLYGQPLQTRRFAIYGFAVLTVGGYLLYLARAVYLDRRDNKIKKTESTTGV